MVMFVARDYRRLVVFEIADRLITDVYANSQAFPVPERFGLQAQMSLGRNEHR